MFHGTATEAGIVQLYLAYVKNFSIQAGLLVEVVVVYRHHD